MHLIKLPKHVGDWIDLVKSSSDYKPEDLTDYWKMPNGVYWWLTEKSNNINALVYGYDHGWIPEDKIYVVGLGEYLLCNTSTEDRIVARKRTDKNSVKIFKNYDEAKDIANRISWEVFEYEY